MLRAIANDGGLHAFDDVSTVDVNGIATPTLAVAVWLERTGTLADLARERNLDINGVFDYGGRAHTALSLALRLGRRAAVQALLGLGADPNRSPFPESLLMLALRGRRPLEVAQMLFDHGARFDQSLDAAPFRLALSRIPETRECIRLFARFRALVTDRDLREGDPLTFYAGLVPERQNVCEELALLTGPLGLRPTRAAVLGARDTARRCRDVGLRAAAVWCEAKANALEAMI